MAVFFSARRKENGDSIQCGIAAHLRTNLVRLMSQKENVEDIPCGGTSHISRFPLQGDIPHGKAVPSRAAWRHPVVTKENPSSYPGTEVMEVSVFRDGVIAFFSAVGMTTVVWLLAGAVLHAGRPTIPGLLLVLPVRGDAPALEHDVRELRRIQGGLPGAKIVIADCGLTEEARGLANYLADREENAAVTDGGTLRVE